LFPIQTAKAFPKTYFDIFPSVSADKVTVTVGASVILLAEAEIGIAAVLGSKSSKKQLAFCAKSDMAEAHPINKHNATVLVFIIGSFSVLITFVKIDFYTFKFGVKKLHNVIG